MGGSLRGSIDISGACGNGGTKCGQAARSGPAGSPAFSCRNDLTPYRMRLQQSRNTAAAPGSSALSDELVQRIDHRRNSAVERPDHNALVLQPTVVTPVIDRDPANVARVDSFPLHEGSERLEHVPYLNPSVPSVCLEDLNCTSPSGFHATIRHRIPRTSAG